MKPLYTAYVDSSTNILSTKVDNIIRSGNLQLSLRETTSEITYHFPSKDALLGYVMHDGGYLLTYSFGDASSLIHPISNRSDFSLLKIGDDAIAVTYLSGPFVHLTLLASIRSDKIILSGSWIQFGDVLPRKAYKTQTLFFPKVPVGTELFGTILDKSKLGSVIVDPVTVIPIRISKDMVDDSLILLYPAITGDDLIAQANLLLYQARKIASEVLL